MFKTVQALRVLSLCLCVAGLSASGHSQRLSTEVEVLRVTGIGFVPQTVQLVNTYTQAVPVCTYSLPSPASPPVIPRVRNITATSFQLSIQSLPDTDPGGTGTVHCIVAEEGTHTLPGGRVVQAITQLVTGVSGLSTSDPTLTANVVPLSVSPSFSASPIVLGAVISGNDARASVFFANDCEARQNEPFVSGLADGICVGRHIGQLTDTPAYAAETIGVILVEAGIGTAGIFQYVAARGPNTIDGVLNNGGAYTVAGDFDIGIATQVGENGGQGGWAVLFGADPLPNNQLLLAIEEEIAAGDTTRGHINEIVDYWLFRLLPSPELEASKSVTVFDPLNEDLFAVPGNDVTYTINVVNTGAGATDSGSLFLVDALPPEVIFFNGDADGPGPSIDPVVFADMGSGLSFSVGTDLAFASGPVPPASFADCLYTPSGGYDPAVRFLCFNPQGQMQAGAPAPSFRLSFRARLQ